MLLTPDPLHDNAALLNAMIAHTAVSGGGVVRVASGRAKMAAPIFLRSNVHLECDRTRFVWDRPSPGFCAIPDVFWTPDTTPGGLAPLCDANGLILGKTPPVGVQAVLRWDDVNAYR
ncbi:MAG TPA: hypothetical protein VM597_12200, partial [Gemmataceae bacterium]|nr:hypothetical protein [Gemmataceae bacterium]